MRVEAVAGWSGCGHPAAVVDAVAHPPRPDWRTSWAAAHRTVTDLWVRRALLEEQERREAYEKALAEESPAAQHMAMAAMIAGIEDPWNYKLVRNEP